MVILIGQGTMLGTDTIDEMTLKRLWGAELNQLKPEVKAIILSALRKARERREQNQTPARECQTRASNPQGQHQEQAST